MITTFLVQARIIRVCTNLRKSKSRRGAYYTPFHGRFDWILQNIARYVEYRMIQFHFSMKYGITWRNKASQAKNRLYRGGTRSRGDRAAVFVCFIKPDNQNAIGEPEKNEYICGPEFDYGYCWKITRNMKKEEFTKYVAPMAKVVAVNAQSIICTSTERYRLNSNGLNEDDFE